MYMVVEDGDGSSKEMFYDNMEEHFRNKISLEVSGLELPYEWKPNEVIRYIVRKIEKRS